MGLFDTRQKQLEALEREVMANPTPVNMVALVEKFMAKGDESRALEWAKKAVDKFPDSEKCSATYQNIRKMQLQKEIVDLNQAIRKNPAKSHYEKLATLYFHELGNRNKAYETALEGLNRFEESDGLHLTCGQVRMERFHQDFTANDFSEAVRHLERSVELNPRSYKALMMLARLYSEVGAFDKARPAIEKGLQMSPGDANLGKLLQIATAGTPRHVDDALEEVEARHALTEEGTQIRRIFEPSPRGGTVLQISPAKIEAFLANYESVGGYKCSAVITREGTFVAAHTRGMVSKERFTQLVQSIVRSAEDAAKRMDAGSFVNGSVESSIGRVAIAEWKNFVIGVLADAPAKKEDLDAAVERFISFVAVS